jgi:tetratricopeptide (TPR) repeat protein
MKPKAKSKSTTLSPVAQKARKTLADAAKQINSLIQQSRTALEEGELQVAHDLASKACSLLPANSTNTNPIELLGEINIELENFEPALQCFTEAIRRRENVDPETFELGEEGKFLWMGQLDEGDQAENWYTKGLEILQHLLETNTDDDQRNRIREKLCSTYCSLIELFLTDLWYHP